MLKDFERRLRMLEAVNQSRILKYGNITIDGENNRIVVAVDATNRILIDGVSGVMKISKNGVDVLTAPDSDLIFSTEFGSPAEHYYYLCDHRWQNGTPWVYAGPWNPNLSQYEPIPITLNISDFNQAFVYFEAIFGGPAGVASEARLYNITDGAAVDDSALSFTPVAGECSDPLRTSALSLPSGSKNYAVQIRRQGGTASDYPSIVAGRLVIRVRT